MPHASNLPARRRALLGLAGALALAACGGSDPDTPPPPAAAAPTFSAQPATLTVGEGGSATFTAGVDGHPAPALQWHRDGAGAISGATSASYTVGAVGLLHDGQRFGVTATNSVGSASSAWATLNVTERAWTTAALPPSGVDGDNPGRSFGATAVAVDSRGHTHAVFNQQEANGGYSLWAAMKPAGASDFSGFVRISGPVPAELNNNFDPRIAVGTQGHVVVVWRHIDANDTTQARMAAFMPSGAAAGAWTAPQAAWGGVVESLTVVPAGADRFEIVLAGAPPDQFRRDVIAVRASLGGGTLALDAPAVLDTSPNNVANPLAAGHTAGKVVVVWNESGEFSQARGVVRDGDAAWSAPVDFGGLSTTLVPASVALDAQGRGMLAMQSDQTRVYARAFTVASGVSFAGDAAYVSNFTHWHVPPVVVAGVDGRFELLSVHNFGLQLSRTAYDGSGWSALQEVRLVPGDSLVDVLSRPLAGVDAAGNLIVAWAEYDLPSTYPVLRARRWHAGLSEWRSQSDLFTNERVLQHNALAVQPDGSAQALVVQGNGTVAQAVFR